MTKQELINSNDFNNGNTNSNNNMSSNNLIILLLFGLLTIIISVSASSSSKVNGECPFEYKECPNVQKYMNEIAIRNISFTEYKDGEILYPDYVHDDTLQVTHGAMLTILINSGEVASDIDIAEALYITTQPYHRPPIKLHKK